MNKSELYNELKSKGVKVTTKMTKAELEDLYLVHLGKSSEKHDGYQGSPEV